MRFVMETTKVQDISAVTLAVRDMARAVKFYRKLGFELFYGGADARFSSLRAGRALINLEVQSAYLGNRWGRVIFRVDDVDTYYLAVKAADLTPDHAPYDASWGECFFHIHDPDGHELSFAQLLGPAPEVGYP